MPLGERALRPAASKSQSAGREAGLQLVDALITTAAAMSSPTTEGEDEDEDAAGAGASSPMSLASDDGKLTAGMLSSSLLVLIEHLCHRAPERAEARATVVGAVEFILRRLPDDERYACASLMEHEHACACACAWPPRMITSGGVPLAIDPPTHHPLTHHRAHFSQFANKFSRSAKVSHRVFAVDLVAEILKSQWIWQDTEDESDVDGADPTSPTAGLMSPLGMTSPIATNAPPSNPPAIVLLSLITSRAADRVPTVRSRALGALTALAAASRACLDATGNAPSLEMTIGGVHDQQVGTCTGASLNR